MTARMLPAALVVAIVVARSVSGQQPAERWWSHVTFLANDSHEGPRYRQPRASQGRRVHRRSVQERRPQAGRHQGLLPAGAVPSRRIVEAQSSLALVRVGKAEPVVLGDEATFSMRIEPAPSVEAPLVFAGYGLQVPESKHDDLAGLDLKGKIVVLLTGGAVEYPRAAARALPEHPLGVSEEDRRARHHLDPEPEGTGHSRGIARSSRASCRRWRLPIRRSMKRSGQQVAVTVQPGTRREALRRLRPHLRRAPRAVERRQGAAALSAAGVGARQGRDQCARRSNPTTSSASCPAPIRCSKNEYVVISAHLDHVGVGEPINGDAIYNGAMDNASGIATLLETAAAAAAAGGYKRSVVFAAVTAEEKGLLGSRYFANRIPMSGGQAGRQLNTDMFLPLFPLKSWSCRGSKNPIWPPT